MNLEWARSWYGTDFTTEGLPKKRHMYADVIDFSDYGLDFHCTTFDENCAWFQAFVTDGNRQVFEMLDYVGDERGGSTRWTWHGSFVTDVGGLPTAGKKVEVPGVSHVTFDGNGKLVRIKDYWNFDTFLKQLGRGSEWKAPWAA